MSGKEAESKRPPSPSQTSRWTMLALVLAAIVFVVRFIAPQTIGEQVRRHVEQTLREQYPGLEVSIARGRVEPSIGLILDDIQISAPAQTQGVSKTLSGAIGSLGQRLGIVPAGSRELIRVRQLVLVVSADWQRLLDQQNPISSQRMIVRGVQANAWVEPDGTYSLQALWPPPKFGDVSCPRVEIRDAKLTLINDTGGASPVEIALSKALILKQYSQPTGEGDTADARSPKIASQTSVRALGMSTFSDQFKIQSRTVDGTSEVRLEAQSLRLTDDWIQRLPAALRSKLSVAKGLELIADAGAVVRLEKDNDAGVRVADFKSRIKILDGHYRHPKSSMPIKRISGLVTCDPKGARLEACQAYWGESRLNLDGNTAGFSTPLRATLHASAMNLLLDQRLAAIVPAPLATVWQKFEPRGLVDVNTATFSINGSKIDTDAEVTCKGVDVLFEKFPYPVTNLTGSFRVRQGRVKSDLISGQVGGRLMQCLFDVPTKPDPTQRHLFSVGLDGPIAVDSELMQALTPRGQDPTALEQFTRSLSPLGAIHLVHGTLQTDPGGQKHQTWDLKVTDGTLRYEKFPYPVYNVTGDILVKDDLVTLSQFRGSNANGGSIRCEGHYRLPQRNHEGSANQTPGSHSADAREQQLELVFSADRLSLDESLRSSLPESSQYIWDNLWPSGVLDAINLRLQKRDAQQPLDISLVGRQNNSGRIGSDTLRLQPTALPYRLDVTEGLVRYENDQVLIESISAQHGQSRVWADGGCERQADGRWLLKIDVHSGSRLIPDAELTAALPQEMRGALRGLNLRGPVGLSGSSQTLLSDATHTDPAFAWQMKLQLEGNRIGEVGPVHALRGELDIDGRKDASGLVAEGAIRIDSMHVNDLQITQLRGPYQIINDQLRLGGIVGNTADGNTATRRPIQGRLFGGVVKLEGDVTLSDASFEVGLALEQAKLPQVLVELGQSKSDLSGTLIANMKLEGLLGTTDLLRGSGQARVGDANLYQLPVLVQLLNVLSISPTEDVAFTNADIKYTLIEDQLLFNDLKLWGSLIALHGSGTMDRRHNLDLTFNTRVSPRNTFTRILRPLSNQRYTLWTIDVRGPLDSPDIERRALDGVGQTLERLFPGMNTTGEGKRKDRTAGIGRMFQ